MSTTALEVQDLGKRYLVGRESDQKKHNTFRENLVLQTKNLAKNAIEMARGRPIIPGDRIEEFWALNDVSFELDEGEVLGIIGRNGAGKSTLLKLLSRITEPTRGKVTLHGRVASLLEVGTGFHPELTGRENIFLNGAILGMTRKEIRDKFDEIVDFAGVETFLDTPVKRYSSGMYVRLAFAVAAHLEPEILVVDEVLAVGDAEFQRKCLGKMQSVASGGRTVLFVSHNMTAISSLCSKGLVLSSGKVDFFGSSSDAVYFYTNNSERDGNSHWRRISQAEDNPATFEEIKVEIEGDQPNLTLICKLKIHSHANVDPCFVAIDILDNTLSPLMQALPSNTPFTSSEPGEHSITVSVDLPPLVPGNYTLSFWLGPHFNRTFDHQKELLSFEVLESPSLGRTTPHTPDHGSIVPKSSHDYQFTPSVAQ